MDDCFDCIENVIMIIIGIVVVAIVGGVLYWIYSVYRDDKEITEAKINGHRNRYDSAKEGFDSALNSLYKSPVNYDSVFNNLDSFCDQMLNEYRELPESYRGAYSSIEDRQELANKLKAFGQGVKETIEEVKMLSAGYGNVNLDYFNCISSLKKENVDAVVDKIAYLIEKNSYKDIWKTNIRDLIDAIWFYAINKPFSSADFEKSKSLLNTIYSNNEIQWFIAEAYAINQMGGSNVLRDKINELLKNCQLSVEELTLLASGFMWMKAYNEESIVLNYMLSNKVQMTAKLQERLHSLSNGGGNAPTGHNVVSKDDEIYVDVSSLSWKDKEYDGFFENLIFQEKPLSYSLAIRDEDKDLFISKAFSIPGTDNICKKISELFEEEFGSDVSVKKVICNALSGNGSEKIEGILAKSNACKQLGVFVNVARIGKKVNIKFYTLYLPENESIDNQKQEVISLYQKLSPVVTMWEKSMQETILMAIQQILNSVPTSNEVPGTPASDEVEF